jgi:hypothetical protein
MEGVEHTKVKYTHNGDTLRNPLNINFDINNKRQNWKVGTEWGGVLVRGGSVNKGDWGKGIWLMNFIKLYQIEQRNLLQEF